MLLKDSYTLDAFALTSHIIYFCGLGIVMAKIGKYCKAYLFQDLCQFNNWNNQINYLRKETKNIDGKEVELERPLTDEDVIYLQENYIVTDGIFLDENIIFDNVIPEWQAFCQTVLQFKVPVDELKTEV